MFRTKYMPRDTPSVSVAGSGVEDIYKMSYNDKGQEVIVLDSQTDVYAKIQAATPECDINRIIERHLLGDDSLFMANNGEYFDATDIPSNFAELLNRVSECKSIFDGLPLETKEKFNMNYAEFWQSAGSLDWADKMGFTDVISNKIEDSVDIQPIVKDTVMKGDVINE